MKIVAFKFPSCLVSGLNLSTLYRSVSLTCTVSSSDGVQQQVKNNGNCIHSRSNLVFNENSSENSSQIGVLTRANTIKTQLL
jgi:hypothetical protein